MHNVTLELCGGRRDRSERRLYVEIDGMCRGFLNVTTREAQVVADLLEPGCKGQSVALHVLHRKRSPKRSAKTKEHAQTIDHAKLHK